MKSLLASANAKKNFTVDAVSEISVILKARKAKGYDLKTEIYWKRTSLQSFSWNIFWNFWNDFQI